MADILLQFIQWAIPSGGIGAAIVWFANRKANNAKNAKIVHDTYKGMYEDISKVLLETQQKYGSAYGREPQDTPRHQSAQPCNRGYQALSSSQFLPCQQ